MSSAANASHRATKFDVVCQEKEEYEKVYGQKLSYGYYSAYLNAGKMPDDWYEHLISAKKDMSKDFLQNSVEYEEYKHRYHRKLTYFLYLEYKKGNKLQPQWYDYLNYIGKIIGDNFEERYTEYLDYMKEYSDYLFFFEYCERKDKVDLPTEWYLTLLQLRSNISDMISQSEL